MKTSQNERGRSMVEILGVLAVIGVLSIGGIQGYRYAMEKHRANDIVNEVNLRTRDTWNMYQTKDLPDEEEITEWADMTQTGFPIGVYPRSEILFDVEVENVPNGVCKKVLNMDIQGPLFIWVPRGEERLIYNGDNPEICGEDGDESVNMVFTTSLESFGGEQGLRENPLGPDGRPFRYCMSDDDCRSCELCDISEYVCKSNCPDATPICHSTNEVCVGCESNSDCQNNNICNEENWTCEVVPTRCEDGYFRSKNGACIKCDYPANMKDFCRVMTDMGMGEATPPCKYESIKKVPVEVTQLACKTTLWRSHLNRATMQAKKQIEVALKLMDLLAEKM